MPNAEISRVRAWGMTHGNPERGTANITVEKFPEKRVWENTGVLICKFAEKYLQENKAL
jgi:hypothetical protein